MLDKANKLEYKRVSNSILLVNWIKNKEIAEVFEEISNAEIQRFKDSIVEYADLEVRWQGFKNILK